uniref:Triatin-like salivary lipocalin n=1 Tax=Triatoma matogrossensis TaxID=162370 RepID=E2J720_9HEMI
MKTIIAVIFFVVMSYASEQKQKLEYGQGSCKRYGGIADFDPKKFFSGNWSLTHATRSTRVTDSTVCRDYDLKMHDNGTIEAMYGYNENRCGNPYDVHCYGTQNSSRKDEFNFDCHLHNDREEKMDTHIDAYFLATDYDTYCVVYRCVTTTEYFEDNLFILFRPGKTDESYAKILVENYGLTMNDILARKDATCAKS